MNVEPLVAVYGPASSNGLGSAVFVAADLAGVALEAAAAAWYEAFVGASWAAHADAWRSGFAEVYRRPAGDTRGIVAELQALQAEPLPGVVDVVVNCMGDPAVARAALAGAFDGTAIRDLRIFVLGDGQVMTGLEVAALDATGEALFLVVLLD